MCKQRRTVYLHKVEKKQETPREVLLSWEAGRGGVEVWEATWARGKGILGRGMEQHFSKEERWGPHRAHP